jgi:DNA-binding transcriptional LysR family regulator
VEGLSIYPYAVDRLVIVTPRDHLLASQHSIRLAAVGLRFCLHSRASSNYLFLRVNVPPNTGGGESQIAHGFESVLSLVASEWVWLWFRPACWRIGSRPSFWAVIELDEPWALRKLNLAVRKDARFPNFITACMNFLLEDPWSQRHECSCQPCHGIVAFTALGREQSIAPSLLSNSQTERSNLSD